MVQLYEKGITTHLKRYRPVAMTNSLVDFKKISSLPSVWLVSLEASLENVPKKSFFRLNHWRFSRKAKCLTVVAIVAVLLVSVFAFLPKQSIGKGNVVPQSGNNSTATPSPAATNHSKGSALSGIAKWFPGNGGGVFSSSKPPGVIASAKTLNSTVWVKVAANAWAYFNPNVGVDSNTGLPYAGNSFTSFTDWDLGVYIQAIIDANKIGLVGNDGAWGSDARIDKVLTFLETRDLNNNSYPYQFYSAITGKDDSAISGPEIADIVDTGRLFVALNNLRTFNSSLTVRIDNIVLNGTGNPNGGSNYTALVPSIISSANSNSIYAYYFASGFASFWPTQVGSVPNQIMNNIVNSPSNVTTYNVTLPDAPIGCEPLLCSVFELNNNNPQLMTLANQVYLAHEAYYNSTSKYVAFSEGNSFSSGNYIWEWVVAPDGNTWEITTSGSSPYSGNPVIYMKVAFSFLALYNTTFAYNMVVHLEAFLPDPAKGYSDGADNNGQYTVGTGSNTNGLILDAALYAIQNNP